MEDIFRYIDAQVPRFVERLQGLCRQPSIAAQNVGIQETARMVARLMEEVGVRAELYGTDGAPVVYGTVGDGRPTLLIYNHYDVQPPEPLELWESPPFAAEIRDGKLYARGAADNKGNLVARLCAVEAWLQTRGRLPLTVKFVVEGEEEVSSAHLHQFVRRHRDLIAADGCIWEAGGKDIQETPGLYMGAKGILYVELEARGANRDLHSSQATIVPNPAWRLVWALSTLKDRHENILIEGFYDDVAEPTPEEMEHLRRIAAQRDDDLRRRDLGLDQFLLGLSGLQLVKRNLYQPTCTICGFGAGYTGQGSKTVLPSRAVAKLDFRLVPNQRPDDIFQKLRTHLAQHGFADIEVRLLGAEHPARTPVDSVLARVVQQTVREIYGRDPIVSPLMAATGPMYELTAQFGIPTVGTGAGYAHSNSHAPNENIRLDDFVQHIKHIALVFERFAQAGNGAG
ncbi:MAG: M20/M25/M40 family metallo-hydrolase [Armatimonadota bacterium]|nr:M20/M25/M40 family metallo-hydrolase [Armatimonadota bacterium]MDR7452157.1 M20/M25/M40 family metallo-hydrolase [Armatimonadota bacterium]MDR7494883.1 M20/M25/M40 family metallo-hydrolase [Armatimonadota bacterium]MDR7547775.1 M20/M25/M40 family metallo-hydrolase [Armatimonadota bacterium]